MTAAETPSPFALAYAELSGLGYSCIPIIAKGKAPGDYRGRTWKPAFGWQKYRDRLPTSFETGLWCRNWPDANIGVILGTRHGGKQLVAVDFDVTDPDILDELARTIPVSPMRKRGAKGFTAFYLAPAEIRSQKVKAGAAGAIDILTGNETRQTVMPPSLHPDGHVYAWLAGPVALADLPSLSMDDLERLIDTAACWLPATEAPALKTVVPLQPVDGPFAELNAAALADLACWVPDLDGLDNLQRKVSGYMAVAAFRPSSSGRPLSQRKQNLSITGQGIKDFGTDTGYSPLDLVMAANGMGFDAAFGWLQDRVFPPAELPAVHVTPAPAQSMAAAEIMRAAPGLSATSLSAPGLVGEIADWITASSAKPQPLLSLAAALTVVGTVIGRRVATPYRNGATHLYIVGLAPTGSGKEHPRAACNTLLTAAGLSHLNGPGEFMSLSAVVKRLQRGPLMLCAMDEFGAFCGRIMSKKASGHERSITAIFRQAWGTNFTEMPTPEWAGVPSVTIKAPAMSIFGVTTAEEMWAAMTGADVKNGLLNRFLLVENPVRPKEHTPKADHLRPPQSIIASLQKLAGGPLANHMGDIIDPKPLAWGAGTEAAFTALRRSLDQRSDANPDESDYLQRVPENALRVATIIAAGRFSSSVDVSDFQFGADLALQSADMMLRSAREHMSETEHQANSKMVLGIIKRAGRISRRDLYRKIAGRIEGRALDGILKALVDAEVVVEGTEKPMPGSPGGRPSRAYSISFDG